MLRGWIHCRNNCGITSFDAMNGGYRFLCSYPPDNQTWQEGTSPFSDRRYISSFSYFCIDMLVFGGVFMISTGARCLSINSKVIWSCGLLRTFFVHCHKGASQTSIPASTLSTATAWTWKLHQFVPSSTHGTLESQSCQSSGETMHRKSCELISLYFCAIEQTCKSTF